MKDWYLIFFAAITVKALLVSPNIENASGFSFIKILLTSISDVPIKSIVLFTNVTKLCFENMLVAKQINHFSLGD